MKITLDDGAKTTLEQWGDRGPVMLCVHGMTSSRLAWRRLGERFGSQYRLLAYDQRGHGDSAGVRGPMSLERGVRDLHDVIASVGGADILVGHSWGGAAAIRGGLHEKVRAVAAIDPMIVQVEKQWYDEYVAELDETFAVTGAKRDEVTRADFAQWHPLDVEGKVHAVHSMTSAPIARLYSENTGGAWNLIGDIARYDKPLLLAMADREESIVPPQAIDEVTRTHAPSVEIVKFAGHGHNLYRTGFDAFADALARFLATTPGRRG